MRRPSVLALHERLDIHPDYTGKGVCVGFIDSGFHAHPDMMWPKARVRGYVDVTRSKPRASDFHEVNIAAWHGTMTTCCACGSGYLSGGRYRGVASDSELVLIKVGVEGRILATHVSSAIRFAVRHPELQIKVLNLSLGVEENDPDAPDVEKAVTEAVEHGIVVVAAAGNNPGAFTRAPGSARDAITVAGYDDQNTRDITDDSVFPSSSGSPALAWPKPDFIAPAARLPAPMLPGTLQSREAAALFQLVSVLEDRVSAEAFWAITRGSAPDPEKDPEAKSLAILREAVGQRIEQGRYINSDYQWVHGTSFSSAVVTAIIAQMLEANPLLTPSQIRDGLMATARMMPNISPKVQGAGVCQPRQAVEWAEKKRQSLSEKHDVIAPKKL